MILILEVVSLLLEVMYVVDSTPEGAPFDACESMDTGHGVEPQTSPCPYEFKFMDDKTEILVNDSVVFIIKTYHPRKFMGFMVQARNAQDKPIGHFDLHSYNIKVFSCPGGERNTATHNRPDPREETDMVWYPPYDFRGDVTFYYRYHIRRDMTQS